MNPVTPFNFGAHAVRVVMRKGEPWFVAADVCAALDYRNVSKAVADHTDEDERYNETLDRGGSLLLISESGMYALVLRSHKPAARTFAKWVTRDVLPAIRRTGSYGERDRDLWKQLQALIAREVESKVRASFGSHLMIERKREIPYFTTEHDRLQAQIQPSLLMN